MNKKGIIILVIFNLVLFATIVYVSKKPKEIVLTPSNGWECAKVINDRCTFYRRK